MKILWCIQMFLSQCLKFQLFFLASLFIQLVQMFLSFVFFLHFMLLKLLSSFLILFIHLFMVLWRWLKIKVQLSVHGFMKEEHESSTGLSLTFDTSCINITSQQTTWDFIVLYPRLDWLDLKMLESIVQFCLLIALHFGNRNRHLAFLHSSMLLMQQLSVRRSSIKIWMVLL